MENRKLAIKSNNTVCKEVCPICGDWHKDAGWPFWIFPEDTYEGICRFCAEKKPDVLSEVESKNQAFLQEQNIQIEMEAPF